MKIQGKNRSSNYLFSNVTLSYYFWWWPVFMVLLWRATKTLINWRTDSILSSYWMMSHSGTAKIFCKYPKLFKYLCFCTKKEEIDVLGVLTVTENCLDIIYYSDMCFCPLKKWTERSFLSVTISACFFTFQYFF